MKHTKSPFVIKYVLGDDMQMNHHQKCSPFANAIIGRVGYLSDKMYAFSRSVPEGRRMLPSMRLHVDAALAGWWRWWRAGWSEDTKVDEPRAAVEFRVWKQVVSKMRQG